MTLSHTAAAGPLSISVPAAFWLAATAVLALAVYYVVGIDQGAVALVDGNSYVHEFLHDARHLLGFPCH